MPGARLLCKVLEYIWTTMYSNTRQASYMNYYAFVIHHPVAILSRVLRLYMGNINYFRYDKPPYSNF